MPLSYIGTLVTGDIRSVQLFEEVPKRRSVKQEYGDSFSVIIRTRVKAHCQFIYLRYVAS